MGTRTEPSGCWWFSRIGISHRVVASVPFRVATGCGLGGMPPTIEALALLSMPLRYHSERVYHGTNRLLAEADRVLLARLSSTRFDRAVTVRSHG